MHWSVSQEKYCGGFSSVDPPLSIPNREVKRTYADGTDRPVGRVGSRRSSDSRAMKIARLSFFCALCAQKRRTAATGCCLGALPLKYPADVVRRESLCSEHRPNTEERQLPFSVIPTLDFHPQNRPFWCLPRRKPSSRHETALPGVCPGKSSTGSGKNA